jgi:hypothetical protein
MMTTIQERYAMIQDQLPDEQGDQG